MKKIIILIVAIGTILFSDAIKVTNIAEKATFRIVNFTANGTGTGFLINDQGYVITNNHVTDGYTPGKLLILNKYKRYENVKMIKTYQDKDLTILKIEGYSDGEFLKLQTPTMIQKGHESFSLGYPGGSDIVGDMEAQLDSTVKSGDVSKILTTSSADGKFPLGYKLIETSSDINGGNSGGPLLSRIGSVIGINTFKSDDAETLTNGGSVIQGIFWAIHVEELIKVLDENNIKYTLSTDDIGEIDTTGMQEDISDVQSNSKLIFIAMAIIVAVLVLIMYLVKKNSSSSVKSGELSKLIRDKMRRYKKREDILPTPPSPQPTPVRKKTISILESLIPENSSLPIISLESKKSITLGRSNECDISINDTEISKKHLRITLIGALVEIEDLGSANGTYIDGKKLDAHKKIILKKDERLLIANENNVYSIKDSKRKIATSSIKLVAEDLSLPVIHIKGKLILGRSQKSDITIDNDEVSRTHLEIQEHNGKVEIKDLGSGNGTYINGKKLIEGDIYYLLAGDQLVIGSEDVIYKIG